MRYLANSIRESLTFFPAVLLLGARQIGKSTLAQALVKEGILAQYLTLDDISVLSSVRNDPDRFLANITGSATLDEIQRAPDLMRALKKNIDENRKPGRFLLTGSANVLAHPAVTESLAGRLDILTLEGLSVAELQEKPAPIFFKTLLQASWEGFKNFLTNASAKALSFTDGNLQEAIFFGGFPEVALARQQHFAERYFQAYQTTYIEKDVRDLARGIDIVQFAQAAKTLMLHTGNLVNIKNLSNDLGLDQRTLKRYAELLEMTFQVVFLQPWYRNTLKRLIKTPKVYAKDSGFACFAFRAQPHDLYGFPYMGQLLETFFFTELRNQTQLIPGVSTYFYRTHNGREVDFVLSYGNRLFGLEIKAAHSVTAKDFAGLKDLQEANGNKLDAGIVFYQGSEIVHFADNLMAIPLKYGLMA